MNVVAGNHGAVYLALMNLLVVGLWDNNKVGAHPVVWVYVLCVHICCGSRLCVYFYC